MVSGGFFLHENLTLLCWCYYTQQLQVLPDTDECTMGALMTGVMTAGEQHAHNYAQVFADLTPDRIEHLCTLLADEVHFRDPFNDLYGRESVRALLQDMFERTGKPAFQLLDMCWHESSRCSWLRWQFSANVPVIGELNVEGSSRIRLDEAGRVTEHLDYWDSAPVYLQLPLIGRLLHRIKQKMALPALGKSS